MKSSCQHDTIRLFFMHILPHLISDCHDLTVYLACCLPAAHVETYAFGSQQLPFGHHCATAYLGDYKYVNDDPPIRLLIPRAACHLQDAQAGRNVIECLLRYLDKGGHWTDSASISLRSVAIGIMRKV